MADTSKLAGTAQVQLDSVKDDDVVITTSEEIPAEEETEVELDDEPETETETDKTGDLDENELKEAQNLYKLLKDPSTSTDVLRVLANKAGLLSKPNEDKRDTTEKVETVQEILREALGKDMAWLADKLGPAIEKIVGKTTTSVEQRFNEAEQTKVVEQTNSAIERLAKETKGESKRLEKELSALAGKYQPGPDVSPYEYLKGLYEMASAARTANKTKLQTADRINRNAANVADRLQPTSGVDSSTKPGKKGLNAAIDSAFRELSKKGR